MVAKAELRPKDKESRECSVASVNKSSEEVSGLFVDRKRLNLKDDLNRAMKERKDKENDSNW